MKNQWLVNIAMVLISWLTLLFLGRRNIKRFLPAAILVGLLEAWNVQIGKKQKWWVSYYKGNSYIANEFPFNIGPFLIGTMWILKWTYGDFKKFILLNAVVDGFFAFILMRILEKLKISQLVRMYIVL